MNNRLRFLIIFLGMVAVAAVFTFPLWQPLLERRDTEIVFPGLNDAQQAAFVALPTEQQGAYRALLATAEPTLVVALAQAATSPDRVVSEAEQATPQMTDPRIAASGRFASIDAALNASGTVTLYELPDRTRILRFEEFRVINGPELHVILTRNSAPVTSADVGTDYIDLGPLKGNVGNQNYNVPSEVSLNDYRAVVLYSVPFQVVFSAAALTVR